MFDVRVHIFKVLLITDIDDIMILEQYPKLTYNEEYDKGLLQN